ncbi:MAG TPA: 2-amino-4-hydroxy-6-hydroxymethyldihydropteridine diphosphokinase [Puia sp.]|nr:2-amino-4-hydroxy-6-hydroxymethyldihydropteridine diphosphokinase [Puia sp.]
MNICYLLIGGNEGDRERRLTEARTRISTGAGAIRKTSFLYETAPWGNPDQSWFLNQALQLGTEHDARTLMSVLLGIEKSMGRTRLEKNGPRPIDIDILFFNDAVLREPGLIVPHPEIPNRRFVLEPLDEIAPSYIHPVLGLSVHQLLGACTDPLEVKRLDSKSHA